MQGYGKLWKERERLKMGVHEAGIATDSKVISQCLTIKSQS